MASADAKLDEHMARVARELRRRAKHGLFNGLSNAAAWRYIRHCTFDDAATLTRVMFTRDIGHHTSGWLKNPDYENCWHLSTSPAPNLIILPDDQRLAEPDMKTCARWVHAFYGDDARYVWAESPKTEQGKQRGVWHWRLFCDEHWQPIVPRKEVYSRDFTELGWRSASQVLAEDGIVRLETEDGGVIETVVNAT